MKSMQCAGCGGNGIFDDRIAPTVFVCVVCRRKSGMDSEPPVNDFESRLSALERAHDQLHKDYVKSQRK